MVAVTPERGIDRANIAQEQSGQVRVLEPGRMEAGGLPIREEAGAQGSELRLVDRSGSPTAGVLLEILDAPSPPRWESAGISDGHGRLQLDWSGREFAWIRLSARGYATKRTLLEPFEGQRTLVMEPEGRIFGRLVVASGGFPYEGAEVLYWRTPMASPELAAAGMVDRAAGESVVASVRADRNGLFEIAGLSPNASYSLFSRNPLAVSRSATQGVVPGNAEVLIEMSEVWAVCVSSPRDLGLGSGLPTELSRRHSGGKLFSVNCDYAGLLRVSAGLERWLARANRAEQEWLLACFLWSGEEAPGPMVAKVRLPGCEETQGPAQPRLISEALEHPKALDFSSCGTYGNLEFSLAGAPQVAGARQSNIGKLHLKGLHGEGELYYPLDSSHDSYRWDFVVPAGEYEVDLHDAMGFGKAEHMAIVSRSVTIVEGEKAEISLDCSEQGALVLELLRAQGGAWEEDFWCQLEKKVGLKWIGGSRLPLFRGEPMKHRVVLPSLPEGRYALLLAGGFAAVEPAVPSPPAGEMLRVEFEISSGDSTHILLSALF